MTFTFFDAKYKQFKMRQLTLNIIGNPDPGNPVKNLLLKMSRNNHVRHNFAQLKIQVFT